MALVVNDRVQETTTSTGTGSVTLLGAVAGFQSFAVIGNGNTTFYCIADQGGGTNWEVGIGTYSTTGPTLARTTVLASSNSGSLVSFTTGTKSVFVTYPSEKSVNLDASGNVTALGTITSGVWNGTTIPVAYGGTGVTTSSGANSVVLRDASQNVTANNFLPGYTTTVSAAATTTLTAASTYLQRLTGTTTQTYKLPDATTLAKGQGFLFDNDSTGTLTVTDNAGTTVDTIVAGSIDFIYCIDNSTIAGTWIAYGFLPATYDFGTSTANFGTATITNATYQGNTVQPAYGGTGLTTFVGANNALYSSGATTLTAGTLPIAAGGTGNTTASAAFNALSPITSTGDLIIGNGTNSATRLGIGANTYVLTSNGTTATWSAPSTGAGTITTTDYTATAGQTLFTASYTVGLVEVYRNGVKLAQADFTATNGTSITLATGANSGDLIEIVAFSSLNIYSTITTDTFSGNGSTTAFTMSVTPSNAASTLVAISGVVQAPSTYSVSGTTLTFTTAPPSGTNNISVRYLGVPSASAVSTFSGGTTGLTPSSATSGAVTLAGTLNVANGGTGATTLTANNVILGNGTSAVQFVAPGTSGNVLQSNGTTWTSAAAPGATISGTTTTGTYYVVGTTSTSGSLSTAYISNTNAVSYNANTGALTAVSVVSSSDERLKSDIATLTNAIQTVENLRGVSYLRNGRPEIGVIAQEVEKVLPMLVQEDPEGYKSVAYGNMVGLLIEAVKELSAEVKALKAEIK